MKTAIGEVIRESLRKSGKTQEEFAKEMGMTTRSLANLLNKQHVPVDQLIRASKLLKQDFIKAYTDWLYENENALQEYGNEHFPKPLLAQEYFEGYRTNNRMAISLSITGDFDDIKDNIPDFLDVMRKEAENRGLHLA